VGIRAGRQTGLVDTEQVMNLDRSRLLGYGPRWRLFAGFLGLSQVLGDGLLGCRALGVQAAFEPL
jgi:hypothetical protein